MKKWDVKHDEYLRTIMINNEALSIPQLCMVLGYPIKTVQRHIRKVADTLGFRLKGSYSTGTVIILKSVAEAQNRTKRKNKGGKLRRFRCMCDGMWITITATDVEDAKMRVRREYKGVKSISKVVDTDQHNGNTGGRKYGTQMPANGARSKFK